MPITLGEGSAIRYHYFKVSGRIVAFAHLEVGVGGTQ